MVDNFITVTTVVHSTIEKVWYLWTDPKHIVFWNNASDDWHTPKAENDFRIGGKFIYTMAAKDGSSEFDFEGIYDEIVKHKLIAYHIVDGRNVKIEFKQIGDAVTIIESFDPESTNSRELQQSGWQSILDNFKSYAESFGKLETLHFEINIKASVEKVYSAMLDEKIYMEWTSVFNPTSHFKGTWAKGSRIHFLGVSSEGKTEGMIGVVKENIPNKFVSIEYIGMLMDGKEITSGLELEGWIGAHENYTFSTANGMTLLTVDLDVNNQFKSYFLETYPKALEKLKSICEL